MQTAAKAMKPRMLRPAGPGHGDRAAAAEGDRDEDRQWAG